MGPEKDTGLGLTEFLNHSSPPPEAPEASPAEKAEAVKTEEKPVPEVKAPAEVKTDAPAKETPQEKLKTEVEPKVEAKVEEKPAEKKEAEIAPKIDWESDENPYKEYKKRYTDTRDWTTRVNKDSADTKRQLEILQAKLDGTYTDERFKQPEPTTEEIQSEAEIKGKIKASEYLAYQMHGGKEKVEAELKKFNDQFGQNQIVQYRVINSDAPIMEALKVMREWAIVQKYGTEDVDTIVEAIKKETRQELEAELTEKITKQFMARLDKKDNAAPSLTGVRGGGKDDGAKPTGPTPLSSIFSQ